MEKKISDVLNYFLEEGEIDENVFNLLSKVEIEINPEDLEIFLKFAVKNCNIYDLKKVQYNSHEEQVKLENLGYDGAFIVNDSFIYAWNFGDYEIKDITNIFSS